MPHSDPLHQLLALYLSIAIERCFPSKKVERFGSLYKGSFVDVEGKDTFTPEDLTQISHTYHEIVNQYQDVPLMEMVPESAKALWKSREKGPFPVRNDDQGLITFIDIDQKLYHLPTHEPLATIKGIITEVLGAQNAKDCTRLIVVGAQSKKELSSLKPYFPIDPKKDYRSIGKLMHLWDEKKLMPKGYKLYQKAKQTIESLLPMKWGVIDHISPEQIDKESTYQALSSWSKKASLPDHENFYLPAESTKLLTYLQPHGAQALDLLISSLQFNCRIIKIFGFSSKFYLSLGKKSHKNDGKLFEEALEKSGCDFAKVECTSNHAPRIDCYFVDHLGREWPSGYLKRCTEVEEENLALFEHKLITGLEMLINLYIESCNGILPGYLSPEQVRLVPVSERQINAVEDLFYQLRAKGIEAGVDLNFQRLQNRIFTTEKQRVPYLAIVGDSEESKGCLAVRPRKGKKTLYLSVDELASMLKKEKGHFRQ